MGDKADATVEAAKDQAHKMLRNAAVAADKQKSEAIEAAHAAQKKELVKAQEKEDEAETKAKQAKALEHQVEALKHKTERDDKATKATLNAANTKREAAGAEAKTIELTGMAKAKQ